MGMRGGERRRKGKLYATNTLLVRVDLLLHVFMQAFSWALLVCQVRRGRGCCLPCACADSSVLELFSQSFEGPLPRAGHRLSAPQRPCVERETPVSVAFRFYVPVQSPTVLTEQAGMCLQVMVSAQKLFAGGS